MVTAGIKHLVKYDFDDITNLKRYLLLFDKVGVIDLNLRIELLREKHPHPCETRLVVEELSLLKENGLLIDTPFKSNASVRKGVFDDGIKIKEFYELLDAAHASMQDTKADTFQKSDSMTRLHCFILSVEDVKYDFEPLPIISQIALSNKVKSSKSDVINLVIDKFPFPNEKIPWEQIVEYKSDPDNLGRLAGLRTWMNALSKSSLSAGELNDEIEYKLYRYRKALEAHKIKYSSGMFETFIVGGAQIIENVTKLRFEKLAKGLFQAKKLRADLLLSELNSPGYEIGYIYQLNKDFK